MIKVKHLMDAVEDDDGCRIWVEPTGLTRDLRGWCEVTESLPNLGPPSALRAWFERHPDGYEYFRGRYHEHLAAGPLVPGLRRLAWASEHLNVTLLHQGSDPQFNTGVALYEFLSELSTYRHPEP